MPRRIETEHTGQSLGSDDTEAARAGRGPLVPCPGCARHVFAAVEGGCPFCDAALPRDLVARAAPAASRRLSRGEMFAFNKRPTTTMMTTLAPSALDAAVGGVRLDALELAGNESAIGGAAFGGGPQDAGSQFAMYGAPFTDPLQTGGSGPTGPGLDDPGGGAAAYGAPPEPDTDWSIPGAPDDDQGGVHAEYGAPLVDEDPFDTQADPSSDPSGVEALAGGSDVSGDTYDGTDAYGAGDAYGGGDVGGGDVGGGDFAGGDYGGGDFGGGDYAGNE